MKVLISEHPLSLPEWRPAHPSGNSTNYVNGWFYKNKIHFISIMNKVFTFQNIYFYRYWKFYWNKNMLYSYLDIIMYFDIGNIKINAFTNKCRYEVSNVADIEL